MVSPQDLSSAIKGMLASIRAFLLSPYAFFFGLSLLIALHLKGGWIEPDTYAFYNRACLNGLEFTTPILSKWIFSLFGCTLSDWFLIQSAIFMFTLVLIGTALKHFFGIARNHIGFIGLSAYSLYFFLGFEDDHLAFPFIFIICWWFLSNPSYRKAGVSLIMGGILSLLVWQGALLIISLVVISYYFFLLGIGIIGGLGWLGHLGNDIGKSTELTYGNGFAGNLLAYMILFYYQKNKDFYKEPETLKIGFVGLVLLIFAFFQPKWGVYSLIALIPLAHKMFSFDEKIKENFIIIGFIFLLFLMPFLLLFQAPHSVHWELIEKAAIDQNKGNIVLVEWGLGRYFQYKGGFPSQAGGNAGFQDANNAFWLGSERKECKTIASADLIYYQDCH